MRARWVAGRRITAAAAPLMLAAVLVALEPGVAQGSAGGLRAWAQPPGQSSAARTLHGGAAGPGCRDCFLAQPGDGTAWTRGASHPPAPYSDLGAVAATSPRNAWAVGDEVTDFGWNPMYRTWIEHWDGTAWTRQAAPNPGAPYMNLNGLGGVAATSPTNAWAVGAYNDMAMSCCSGAGHTLILHWDGQTWARVPAPNPAHPGDNGLTAAAATSPRNAWAVGTSAIPETEGGGGDKALILHWDGTAWTRVPSPNPGSENGLRGVAATSPDNAWAVGFLASINRDGSVSEKTMILHWDGTAWTRVPSPNPSSDSFLSAVTATSPDNAWAVGAFSTTRDGSYYQKALILHWDGTAWTRIPSPRTGPYSYPYYLGAVAATSPDNAWAVGLSGTNRDGSVSEGALILHWDGTAWTRVPSPDPGSESVYAVAATSPDNAWAVGLSGTNRNGVVSDKALTLHWDGTAWTRVPS